MLLHGGNYLTFDLDVAYPRTRSNAQVLASALESRHPLPAGWPEGLPFVWETETLLCSSILTLDTDLGRIDFLAEPPGAPPFAELKARAVEIELSDVKVYVACIEDLISMKRAAGRPKDLIGISELEQIQAMTKSFSEDA